MKSVRVFFTKKGNMKFVSHLDLNRFMIRMVRMSGIPVWYSEGFNPHPYITFALPLSLGFESDYEAMDIRLDEDEYPAETVKEKLSALMPKGISIFGCAYPEMKAGDISYARFRLDFGADFAEISDKISEFLSSRSILAQKRTKKGELKTVDLQDHIKEYEITETGILLTLSAGGSNNLNPKLLVEAFSEKYGITIPPYGVNRVGLYTNDMQLFK